MVTKIPLVKLNNEKQLEFAKNGEEISLESHPLSIVAQVRKHFNLFKEIGASNTDRL